MRGLHVAAAAALLLATAAPPAADYRPVAGGTLVSVLPPDGKSAAAQVAPFRLRATPVTNAEFLAFASRHAQWRKDSVVPLFADREYLSHWAGPATLGPAAGTDQPATRVSWFAARAYCESEDARLPTWHEWEFAAAADETRTDARGDPRWRERILGWYAVPSGSAIADVGGTAPNVWGVHDLHGLIWEWIDDHGALMVAGDNREQGDPDLFAFCGAGAASLKDRENYAVLMRIAMLSSLRAADTTRRLGFRCAKDGLGETR
ncbi:MAG TPA: formylglycine-generating enzyme family protein [Tahibacter sp.]|uniref:formylglycine-generating enzyme family protein n=1 Tax=Tahibacter sp. TaxID=2056211 RepID=UPI002CEEF5E4|nr:formylglycine-generating enzyme family protein [Tahibacter sp.]HSX59150.1 formylglycine-generating enzyme family protein [Tahibacter sp.]